MIPAAKRRLKQRGSKSRYVASNVCPGDYETVEEYLKAADTPHKYQFAKQ